jgi:hypothetical protein
MNQAAFGRLFVVEPGAWVTRLGTCGHGVCSAPAMPLKNSFKTALAERRPQYGLVLGTGDLYGLEIIAGAGFDWLLLDAEHSARDMAALPQQLALIAASGASAALRPGRLDGPPCGRYLDIGLQTLVAPMIEAPPRRKRWSRQRAFRLPAGAASAPRWPAPPAGAVMRIFCRAARPKSASWPRSNPLPAYGRPDRSPPSTASMRC